MTKRPHGNLGKRKSAEHRAAISRGRKRYEERVQRAFAALSEAERNG